MFVWDPDMGNRLYMVPGPKNLHLIEIVGESMPFGNNIWQTSLKGFYSSYFPEEKYSERTWMLENKHGAFSVMRTVRIPERREP